MFSIVLLCVTLCAGVLTQHQYYNIDDAFNLFVNFSKEYNRNYSDVTVQSEAFKIFIANLEELNILNALAHPTAVFGINQFMDISTRQFLNDFTGLHNFFDEPLFEVGTDENIYNWFVPESFDWRTKNVVTSVKHQNECGCSFAFSAAGVLEGQHAIYSGELLDLSVQQFLDCDSRSDGCCGGTVDSAILSVMARGGILGAQHYPYEHEYMDNVRPKYNETFTTCRVDERFFVASVKRGISWKITSQEKLKRLLYYFGPISIGVRGARIRNYKSGIITDRTCRIGKINHAVLLVGYGTENGVPYWTVKNSWGEEFGESGYFRMVRGEGADSCGMLNTYLTTAELEFYKPLQK